MPWANIAIDDDSTLYIYIILLIYFCIESRVTHTYTFAQSIHIFFRASESTSVSFFAAAI